MPHKVFRTGDSIAVSLPKDALDFLGLTEGAEVSVKLDRDRRQIIIAPIGERPAGVDEEFARQVAEFIEQYRSALEALAHQ
ncbi:MAG TPA: AbrB/MazE/SpoVT family DNA-binding domain-containing protein [Chloroflexi bacterium]|nr:AbrB/MazE/SpoVT family DNA-binding domain-containing protein [Chloroflexota bacterium]